MSQLVVLTGSVAGTSSPQMVSVQFTSGMPSTGLAFKNTSAGNVVWASGADTGWNWLVSPSGGGALLGVASAGGQVAGSMSLNSKMDVDVGLVLNGGNGPIGKQTLPAGQTSVSFAFSIPEGDGLNELQVALMINEFLQG